jgi:hypothetical protein
MAWILLFHAVWQFRGGKPVDRLQLCRLTLPDRHSGHFFMQVASLVGFGLLNSCTEPTQRGLVAGILPKSRLRQPQHSGSLTANILVSRVGWRVACQITPFGPLNIGVHRICGLRGIDGIFERRFSSRSGTSSSVLRRAPFCF